MKGALKQSINCSEFEEHPNITRRWGKSMSSKKDGIQYKTKLDYVNLKLGNMKFEAN